MSDIFGSQILVSGREGIQTVGQLLESHGAMLNHSETLEAYGIKQVRSGSGPTGESTDMLFIDHRVVCAKLLQHTDWARQSIDQILLRIQGAERCRRRIAGRIAYGVTIPDKVVNQFVGEIEKNF